MGRLRGLPMSDQTANWVGVSWPGLVRPTITQRRGWVQRALRGSRSVVGAHIERILLTLMSVFGAIHCLVLPAVAMGWDLTLVRRIFPHFTDFLERTTSAQHYYGQRRVCARARRVALSALCSRQQPLASIELLHHHNRMKRGAAR